MRLMQLQGDAGELMRVRGLEPGSLHRIPDGEGYRLAFGYLQRTPGNGVRQRYFEIPVSWEQYTTLNEPIRRDILNRLEERLGERGARESHAAGTTD